MSETTIMDFARTRDRGPAWVPTAEKVLGLDQLSEVGTGAEAPTESDSPTAEPSRAPGAAGPARRGADPGGIESLGDLTYAELAQVHGLDAAALERLSGLKLPHVTRIAARQDGAAPADGRPPVEAELPSPGPMPRWLSRVTEGEADRDTAPARGMVTGPDPAPATTLMASGRPGPVAEQMRAPGPQLPTWPPAGAPVPVDRAPSGRNMGPVPSRHRPRPHSWWRWAVVGVLILAVVGAGVWALADRTHKTAGSVGGAPPVVLAAAADHVSG